MRDENGQPNTRQMLVFVPPHPLLKHWLAVVRSASTPPQLVRSALAELGRLLVYEAGRDWLPTLTGEVETPTGGVAEVEFVDPSQPVLCVPLLPAGLVLLEQAAALLPAQRTCHYGVTREGAAFLDRLPASLSPADRVLITDAQLATGEELCACLDELLRRGAEVASIRVVACVAAPPALKRLSEEYPGLRLYVAIIDELVDDSGRIVPGIGDAAQRCFG